LKEIIYRNIKNILAVSITLTVLPISNFLVNKDLVYLDLMSSIVFIFSYAFLYIILFGGTSSIIVEVLSYRVARKKRLVIKTLVYLAALTIFSNLSPNPIFNIYVLLIAILFFILD